MALTMDQILKRTSRERLEKALTTVKVSRIKLKLSKATKLPRAMAQVYSLDVMNGQRKTNKYVTSILFMRRKTVLVSCSCPDHMYRWEYALWRKGAAELVYGNGDPPDETNPKQKNACCKHIVALWNFLVIKKLVAPAQKYADKVKNPTVEKEKDLFNPSKRVK